MNEKTAKGFFILSAGFAAGCVSTALGFAWTMYKKAENEGIALSVTPVIAFTDNPDTNAETAKAVMEQTLMPTLLAAMQAGWSPEMFENNIKNQFDMTSKIMISLYQNAAEKENLTMDEFKDMISSEIDFIIIDAKNRDID